MVDIPEFDNDFSSWKTDADYLANYKIDTLYVGDENIEGNKYITYVMQVSPQIKLAIKAFYVEKKNNITEFQLLRLKNDKEIEKVKFSKLDLPNILKFCDALKELDLKETSSSKLKFSDEMNIDPELIKALAESKADLNDIYAIENKRKSLQGFKEMMDDPSTNEKEWQYFFEANPWIFGHGLNYVFLDSVHSRLEQTLKGSDHNSDGKRVDALMKTKARISQYVLIEIKKSSTELIGKEYRSGCWQVSNELSGAVTQIQKTSYEFINNRFKDDIKNLDGSCSGVSVFSIQPKTYLVVGNLEELSQHEDKLICFELYRKSISSPEILTFDELYERAKCIVENVSNKREDEKNERN